MFFVRPVSCRKGLKMPPSAKKTSSRAEKTGPAGAAAAPDAAKACLSSTHIDAEGNVLMVDVSGKAVTQRTAIAEGRISMSAGALEAVVRHTAAKGDVLTVAQIAGIMGAKRTSDLVPLCHPLPLTSCKVDLVPEEGGLHALCTVKTANLTGVEMEALTGVSIALLTVYDMLKGIDKTMEISGIRLLRKTGGKSGDFSRE